MSEKNIDPNDMKRMFENWNPTAEGLKEFTEKLSRFSISALSEELSEDGTLTVHVSDGSKVNRVLVMGDNIFGGLYYPDSAENKGEITTLEAENKALRIKLENAEDVLRGLKEDLADARAELRERR